MDTGSSLPLGTNVTGLSHLATNMAVFASSLLRTKAKRLSLLGTNVTESLLFEKNRTDPSQAIKDSHSTLNKQNPPHVLMLKYRALEKTLQIITEKCEKLNETYKRLKPIEDDPDTCVRYKMEAKRPRPVIHSRVSQYNIYDPESVTLVVSVTPSRFETIERVMKHWEGPVSVALYVPCTSPFQSIIDRLKTWVTLYLVDIHIVLGRGVSLYVIIITIIASNARIMSQLLKHDSQAIIKCY